MKRLRQLYNDCLNNNQYLVTKEEREMAASALAGAIKWARSIDMAETIKKDKIRQEKLSQVVRS